MPLSIPDFRKRLRSVAFFLAPALLLGLLAAACSDDDPVDPVDTAGVIIVNTPAELDDALLNSIAGDTIEVRGEFSSTTFTMTRGYVIPAGRSPLRIVGSDRSTFRPELVFPGNVDGLTFEGHSGSEIEDISFRGGRNVIVLTDSNVRISGVTIVDCGQDGVAAGGSSSNGLIELSLFENPGRFGVSTSPGATVTIENNTIINAGDCGFYIGSNAIVNNNNIVDAQNFGIFCDDNATAPEFHCNNAFQSANGNYVCGTHVDTENNYQLDPEFCAGGYFLKAQSPLAPANSGGCGLIGAFLPVECDIEVEASGPGLAIY